MNLTFRRIKEKVKSLSREHKDEMFYSLIRTPCSVLDVGVYPENEADPEIETNHFLKNFRFNDKYYTGLSIDNMDGMKNLYPNKSFVNYNGGEFPFKDNEFDFAYSNAVIEHVGSYDQKLTFIKEMVRVSKRVYFTTPNKYFPFDSHSSLFFLHWNDSLFKWWRLKYKHWLPLSTLNLLSISEIKRLLADAKIQNYRIVKNRITIFVMTFSVIIN